MSDVKDEVLNLRCLLISNPTQIRASQLSREYELQEGKVFPFKKFGFKSFVDFLRSVPSDIKLTPRDDRNPEVLAVASRESSHIEQLISKQQLPSKRRGRCGFGGARPRRRQIALPSRSYDQYSRATATKGVPVRDIEKDLYQNYDKENLTRNGINSADDIINCGGNMVQRINEKVHPNFSASASNTCYSSNVSHISNGRPELYSDEEDDYFDEDYDYQDHEYQQASSNQEHEERTRKDTAAASNNLDNLEDMEEEALYNHVMKRFTNNGVHSNVQSFGAKLGSPGTGVHEEGCDKMSESTNGGNLDDENNFSGRMLQNFRTILSKHPNGFWCRDLPIKYFEEVGAPLDIQQLGYNSAIAMVLSLPSVFYYERDGNQDYKLHDARRFKDKSHIQSNGNKHVEELYIPRSISNNIKELVKIHKCVKSTNLLRLYEEQFSKKLNIQELYFDNIEDFVEHLKDVVIVRLAYDHHLLLSKDRVMPLDVKPPAEPAFPENNIFIRRSDIVKPGAVIENESLDHLLNLDCTKEKTEPFLKMEIRVGEVFHPHKFYVILASRYMELEDMMDNLHLFYQEEENNYKIARAHLIKDLYCTCIYAGYWHRAKIVNINNNHASILYIDYGTPHKVPISELRYLHVDYCQLPAQAILCKLHAIQPLGNAKKWSKEACSAFLDIVSEKVLLAHVWDFPEPSKPDDPELHSVILYENDCMEMIFNSYLVEKGLAVYCNEAETDSKSDVPENNPTSSIKTPTNATSVHLPKTEYSTEESKLPSSEHSLPTKSHSQGKAVKPPPGFSASDLARSSVSPTNGYGNRPQSTGVANRISQSQWTTAPAMYNNQLLLSYPVNPPVVCPQINHSNALYQNQNFNYPLIFPNPPQFNSFQGPFPHYPNRFPPPSPPNNNYPFFNYQFQNNYIPQNNCHPSMMPTCNNVRVNVNQLFEEAAQIRMQNQTPQTATVIQSNSFRKPHVLVMPPTPVQSPIFYENKNQSQAGLNQLASSSLGSKHSPRSPGNMVTKDESISGPETVVQLAALVKSVESSPNPVETSPKELVQTPAMLTVIPSKLPCSMEVSINTQARHDLSTNEGEIHNFSVSPTDMISNVSDEYASALEDQDENCLSLTTDVKVENALGSTTEEQYTQYLPENCETEVDYSFIDSNEQQSMFVPNSCNDIVIDDNIAKEDDSPIKSTYVPDSWDDIEIDDRILRADDICINLEGSLEFLKDDNYIQKLNLANDKLPDTLNNNKENNDESNMLLNIKKIPNNWKDLFDPDFTSNSKNEQEITSSQTPTSTQNPIFNIKKTLVHKVDFQNNTFHLIYVNNKLAVLPEEFFPLFSSLNWTTIECIIAIKFEDFPKLNKADEPSLMKLETSECKLHPRLKRRIERSITVAVAYISDIPTILSHINVKNENLFQELKMWEESLNSSE